MAIWDYIATYNPTGFYEDNRARTLKNDYMDTQISAAKNANEREAKIMALEDAWANGDADALRKLGIYAPEKRGKMIDNEAAMLEYARPLAQSFLQVAPENRAKAWGQIYNKLSGVMDMSDMSREYTPEIDSAMELIANSDAQKIRDERIDAMNKENATIAYGRDLEKMSIANEYQKERDEASFNRDIAKLQYAYDRADQKTKEAIDFITLQLSEGNIDRETALSAAGKALGVEITAKDPVKELQKEYLNESTTPERRNEILSLLGNYTRATNISKTSTRTPAQELKDMYGAGFTPESIVKFSQTGDINDLEARPVQGGNIAADVQKYNMYNQEKARKEGELGRPLNEQEDLDLQGKIGIDSFEIKNATDAIKHGYKMEEIGAQTEGKIKTAEVQGQNQLNNTELRNQGNIEVAQINSDSRRYAADSAYKAKMDYADFMQKADWREAELMADAINKANPDNPPVTAYDIIKAKYSLDQAEKQAKINAANAKAEESKANVEKINKDIENADTEKAYKQAQTRKVEAETAKTKAETPNAGKTDLQQNAEWLVNNGVVANLGDAIGLLNSKKQPLGKAGDVVNGVTLTGFPAYDEALLKKKAEQDVEDEKNQEFIKKQSVKLKPVLQDAYKAAQDGSGIGYVKGGVNKYIFSTKQGAKNIAAINTLMNMVGPTMIAQLKAAGAGARSFDSEGERQTYLPNFSIYQDSDVLAATIKEFAKKMLDIQL